MLIQAKGLARKSLDPVARHGGAEGACRYRQTQPRTTFMIGQNRQTKIRIGQLFAALPGCTKFGRLMQTLARLEPQFTDR